MLHTGSAERSPAALLPIHLYSTQGCPKRIYEHVTVACLTRQRVAQSERVDGVGPCRPIDGSRSCSNTTGAARGGREGEPVKAFCLLYLTRQGIAKGERVDDVGPGRHDGSCLLPRLQKLLVHGPPVGGHGASLRVQVPPQLLRGFGCLWCSSGRTSNKQSGADVCLEADDMFQTEIAAPMASAAPAPPPPAAGIGAEMPRSELLLTRGEHHHLSRKSADVVPQR